MHRHRGRLLKSLVIVPFVVSMLVPVGASAAVFTTTPPATVTEGGGPITWAFESDAPGTLWGNVTWKVSTEPEWHMCGGPAGVVALEGLGAGTYWVEIADEVDPGFAGASADLPPFTRCTEPHSSAVGPLHPVSLAAVTVGAPPLLSAPPLPSVTATTTVAVVGPPRCGEARSKRVRLRAAIRLERRRLRQAPSSAEADRRHSRLVHHEAALEKIGIACR